MKDKITYFTTTILFCSFIALLSCTLPSYPEKDETPYLISPENKSTNVSITKNFVWNIKYLENSSSYEKINYNFYLSKEAPKNKILPTTALQNATTDNSSLATHFIEAVSLSPNTKYYWQVEAFLTRNEEVQSDFLQRSEVFSFTTGSKSEKDPRFFLITLGITKYWNTNGLKDLKNTYNDTTDLSSAFSKLNDPYHIFQIKNKTESITKSQLKETITNILNQNPTEEDLLVFHYSGHGEIYNDESFLIFSDTPDLEIRSNIDALKGRLYNAPQNLKASELKTLLDPFKGQKMLLIDACYSGSFTEINQLNSRTSGYSKFMTSNTPQYSDFSLGFISTFADTDTTDSNLSNTAILSKTDPNQDPTKSRSSSSNKNKYHIITATSKVLLSWESDNVGNGFFTFSFLDGIGGSKNYRGKSYDYTFDADTIAPYYSISFSEIVDFSKKGVNNLIGKNSDIEQNVVSYSQEPLFSFATYFREKK